MALSDLAQWTPVAVSVGAGGVSVDWGDLRGVRYSEPFFMQTVERWAGGDPAPLVRTGIEALETLDASPSLDPAGFIFHLSRCGSTLCAQMLAAAEGTLVLSEPGPVNDLLMAAIDGLEEERAARLLRLVVRALARRRFGDERHAVFKLSSWNARRISLFRRAFPETPIVWLRRDPIDVLNSLAADPPAWLAALRRSPAFARALLDAPPAPDRSDAVVLALALAKSLETMADARGGRFLSVDYRAFPDAVWTEIAPFLGIALDAQDVARLREAARYDAKSATKRPFAPRRHAAAIPADARAIVEAATPSI
jgi:hypothetical protein